MEEETKMANKTEKRNMLKERREAKRKRNKELLDLLSAPKLMYKYVRRKKIARGGHGVVYRGENTDTGKVVAIKKIKIKREEDGMIPAAYVAEIMTLQKYPHPNIIKLIDSFYWAGDIFLITEYIEGITLEDLVQAQRLTPLQTAAISKGFLKGLHNLHRNKIVHRDLKSDNIMLGEDGAVKIIDMGLAVTDTGDIRGADGTAYWLAPEVVSGNTYDTKVDIWAFGIVLYETLVGHAPYQDKYNLDDEDKILDLIKLNGKPAIPKEVSLDDDVKNLMDRCLEVDPSKRASAEDLLKLPFLQLDDEQCTLLIAKLVTTFRE